MLATTERIMLLDMADELANMIIESEAAEHYRQCLYKLRNSRETQRKLQAFTKMKEMYEEVQRFGKYHPDYKMVMGEIRTVKRELDLDSNIYEFKKAENELQALLDAVSGLIGKSVSESVKVPTGHPFFDSGSSCGGGCGSGGSCGCSA